MHASDDEIERAYAAYLAALSARAPVPAAQQMRGENDMKIAATTTLLHPETPAI